MRSRLPAHLPDRQRGNPWTAGTANRTPGLRPLRYRWAHAAPEPGDAVERADRHAGARARARQPRLPARRARPHPAPLRDPALDRLPARVPRLAPLAADAARPLHGAVLPRRGDSVRRRAPPVRAVPARGLQAVLGRVAGAGGRRRDRSPAARRAARGRRAAPPRGSLERAARRRVRAARRRAVAGPRRRAAALDARRLHRPRTAAGRPGGADHAAVAGRGPARRLGRLPSRLSTRRPRDTQRA